jgi:hypothetical protein
MISLYNIRMMKQMAIVLMLTLIFSLFANAAYAANVTVKAEDSTFSDIQDSYAKLEIESLAAKGILSGFGDGTFKPTASLTRAELAKILVLSLGLEQDANAAAAFDDVALNAWYRGYVGALVKSGITTGTSASVFSPNQQVTRQELAVFFVRAFGLEAMAKQLSPDAPLSDLQEVADWAKYEVSFAFKIGFLKGVANSNGTFRFNPKQWTERQALARLGYEFVTHQQQYIDEVDKLVNGGLVQEQLKAAVKAANDAIAALPAASVLTKDKDKDVAAARVKVDAAIKLGASDKDFADLNKLVEAEKKIAQLNQTIPIYTTPPSSSGPTVINTIAAGKYTGDYIVPRGVTSIGPASGMAEIDGTLIIDPGADKDFEVKNIKATRIEVRSGADHSIIFSQTVQAGVLFVNAGGQSSQVRIVTSANTTIGSTSINSQAILDFRAGMQGTVDITQAAANKDVIFVGDFTSAITVEAQNARILVTADSSVSNISLTGTAQGATVSVEQQATVSQIHIASNATINASPNSIINDVSVDAARQVTLTGAFASTTVSIESNGASLIITSTTTVSVVQIATTVTGTQIVTEGTITSIESTTTVIIDLEGSKKNEAINNALLAANQALNSLPEPAQLTYADVDLIESTRAKVSAAKNLNSNVTFDNSKLTRLADDEAELPELKAIAAAITAITNLPSTITLNHTAAVAAARNLVIAAKGKGAVDADINNLAKLVNAELIIAPPTVKSASITIGGTNYAAVSSNNEFTFTVLNSLADSAIATDFVITSDSDAESLAISFASLSRTVLFTNGSASLSVKALLGDSDQEPAGVSLRKIRSFLNDSSGITLNGQLRDRVGNITTVTITVKKG